MSSLEMETFRGHFETIQGHGRGILEFKIPNPGTTSPIFIT